MKEKFDTVVCFQMLEHLPFSDFNKALQELIRVSKENVIISLPDRSKCFGIRLYLNSRHLSFSLTKIVEFFNFFLPKHLFDGAHYWEIGKKGYSLKSIKKIFKKNGLKIINTYRVFEKPLIRFFILKK